MEYEINSENFDKKFQKILKCKKGENLIKGRFDIESIKLKNKSDYLISFISSYRQIYGLTYKILFWESNETMRNFFNENFPGKSYKLNHIYKNGKLPGSILIDELNMDKAFMKIILDNHFNFEMAEDPSLNIRVQIGINIEDFIILLDIYDDRGFDVYYLKKE